jgi:uncharacterized protein YdaU (DUF1376 family)
MLPWWPSDYLTATRGFTLAERGAYSDLLFYSWINGPLPHEPDRLARLIGVTLEELAAVWPVIKTKFESTPYGLINHRLERERRNSIEMRTKASDKAQQAAKARWSNAPSNASSTATYPLLSSQNGDAPSNARSNASSIGAPQPAGQKPKMMLGAMLEQCLPASALALASSPESASSRAPFSEGERGSSFAPDPKTDAASQEGKPSPISGNGKRDDPEEARVARAAIFLQTTPNISTEHLAKQFGLTQAKALKMIKAANQRRPH